MRACVRAWPQITQAMDGQEALALLKDMLPDDLPDVILLDVMMPGMSGYEVSGPTPAAFAAHTPPVLRPPGQNERVLAWQAAGRSGRGVGAAARMRVLDARAARAQALRLLQRERLRCVGAQVCREIRESLPLACVPVIMISAKGKEENIVEGLQSGSNDYLIKPFGRQVRPRRCFFPGPLLCVGAHGALNPVNPAERLHMRALRVRRRSWRASRRTCASATTCTR